MTVTEIPRIEGPESTVRLAFRGPRTAVHDAVATASRATGKMPPWAMLHLAVTGDRLTVTGHSPDLTIVHRLTVSGDRDGETLVPPRLFGDIVRAIDDATVVVEQGDDALTVSGGRASFDLRTYPSGDWSPPAIPDVEPVIVQTDALLDAIDQVLPAVSGDDTRPILTGVLVEVDGDDARLVATDSYRLAVRDVQLRFPSQGRPNVLIPGPALQEVHRLCTARKDQITEVGIAVTDREVMFQVGHVTLLTRLVEGDFPNYRGLLPAKDHPNLLTVDRASLLDTVRRMAILAQESTPVRFSIVTGGTNAGVEVSALTQDVGRASETLDGYDYQGSDLMVAFNPDYLIDGLESVVGDRAELWLLDARHPALVRGVDRPDFTYLLMPVRVS